ncbi:MAG TPA: response regulator, partial [Cellvibrio sp.]|nr:response regulator [Cellvibrio sp.]
MNILIVEDEIDLGEILQDYLTNEGFTAHLVHDGELGLQKILTEKWDLVLLDLMLPKRDGLSICQEVRKTSQVPIIMTTAKVEEIDRLIGLELGADDYICKPFSPREVVARVKAVLRRTNKTEDSQEEGLRLDKERQYACVGDQCVELTSIEFRILETLLLNKQRVISRDLLLKNAYTDHRVVSDRTMDSHITKLRKKLQPICNE